MHWSHRSAVALSAVLFVIGCTPRDPGRPDLGEIDAPGSDTGGLDSGAPADTSALDTASMDAADRDAPLGDTPGLDAPVPDGAVASDAGAPDGGPVSMPCMATGTCDPFDLASCPANQSCRLGPMGTECLATIPMSARAGEACTRTDGCEPGSLCLDFGAGFQCQRMCPNGSIGLCPPGSACTGRVGDSCVRVCRPLAPRCDIYLQDCADPALACTLVTNGETGERYTGCRPPGTLRAGEMCGGMLGTCAEGLVCITELGVSSCHAVCNPETGGPSCTLPDTCSGTTTGWGVRYCRNPG